MHLLEIHDGALRLATAPTPDPGPGEVVLDVAAAGVNRADLLQVAGHYPPPPGAPEHPGLEVAGRVVALGAAPADAAPSDAPLLTAAGDPVRLGDRVMALLAGGGYASHVAVPAAQLLHTPDTLSDIEAAALPEALATVWSNLVRVGNRPVGDLRAGESVLVLGGSGGIGTSAIQVATLLGARVIATAGGPQKVRAVRELGCAVVLDHHALDAAALTTAVHEATAERGVDVILDVLGGGALAENLRRLATGGRLVTIGTQQGRRGELDLLALMQRRASVHGTTLRGRPTTEKSAILRDVADRLLPAVVAGRLRPVVHEVLPFSQAAAAHSRLQQGAVTGKMVLVPDRGQP